MNNVNIYELMIKINHHIIKGGEFTDKQKENIVNQFLAAKSSDKTRESFLKGVKAPEYLVSLEKSDDTRQMYPMYYIPPYNNGKKFQTVIPMSPKTHILSANSYELEIIRLLCLFAPDNPDVKAMVAETLARLKTTCFGYHDCSVGECFHSALIVLRFLASAAPGDTAWINKLIDFYNRHKGETYRHGNTYWYYCLCLSELPMDMEIAEHEILKSKDFLIRQLTRSSVMNSENDKINHPVMICMLRNCLCRLSEYAYIKNRQPYISEKDGRLHFDMTSESQITII